jgi:hypothetical protein
MASYTVTTLRAPETQEPFRVIVEDDARHRIAELDAMSPAHARLVAGALVMLLPKLDSCRTVVFDDAALARPVLEAHAA